MIYTLRRLRLQPLEKIHLRTNEHINLLIEAEDVLVVGSSGKVPDALKDVG